VPGSHHLELRLRGYDDAATDFELPKEKAIDVQVALTKSAPPETPSEPVVEPVQPVSLPTERAVVADTSSRPMRTWGFIGLGVSGAALAGALSFEILRRRAEDDAKSEQKQVEYSRDFERMESRKKLARICLIGGAAIGVGSAVLLIADSVKASKNREPKLARDFDLACGTGGCFAAWSGKF
jgi:hypothetical protein